MKKLTIGLLATACLFATVARANIQKTSADEEVKMEIQPVFATSFSDGTLGEFYDVFTQSSATIWDENWQSGSVVNEFDGKAYKFTGKVPDNNFVPFGGIKLSMCEEGSSYTLSMNFKMSGVEYVYFEYVSDTTGWGAVQIFANGSLGFMGGQNMSITYDVVSGELEATVTHGTKIWDATTSEPGFFKITSGAAQEGAYVIMDDIVLTQAESLLNETWEDKTVGSYDTNTSVCNYWYDGTTTSIVEYGGGKALSVTGTANEYGYRTMGYLNRLGFLQNGKTYRVSFDYEIVGASKLFIEYVPTAGGAGLEINVDTGIAYCWGNDVNLKNFSIVKNGENYAKGTVFFDWQIFETLREVRLMTYGGVSEAQTLILDNINIDYLRNEITVSGTGNGKVVASTFSPITGKDASITVVPETGYSVGVFKVDGVETELPVNNVYKFTSIAQDHTVEVEFTLIALNITVTAADGITVTKDKETVLYGDDVTFTATVEEGYKFIGARLNGEEIEFTENAYTVTNATEDLVLVVLAEALPEYSMKYEFGEGVEVTVSAAKVKEGGSAVYTVTLEEGYELVSVKYNGETVELTNGTYTVENVTANGKLTVETKKTATVDPSEDPTKGEDGKESSGCGGVLNALSLGGIALAAAGIAVVRRKKRD